MAVLPVSTSARPAAADGFPYNGDFSDPAFIRTYVASLARDATSLTDGIAKAKTLEAFSALALRLDSRISSLLEHPGTLDPDTLHIRLELLERFRVVLRSAEHKDAATADKKSVLLMGDIKIFLDRQVTKLPKAEQAAALGKVDGALKAISDGMHALNAGLHAPSVPAMAAAPASAPDGGAPTTTAPALAPKIIKLPNTAGRFSPKDWRDITETFQALEAPSPILSLNSSTATSLRDSIKDLISGMPTAKDFPSVAFDGSAATVLTSARANLEPHLLALGKGADNLVSAVAFAERVNGYRDATPEAKADATRQAKEALAALGESIFTLFGSDAPQIAAFTRNALGNKKPSAAIGNFLAFSGMAATAVNSEAFKALREAMAKDSASNIGADDDSKVPSDMAMIFESLSDLESNNALLDMNDIADQMQGAVMDMLMRLPTTLVDEVKDPNKQAIIRKLVNELFPKLQVISIESMAMVDAAKAADASAKALDAAKAAAKANPKDKNLASKVEAADAAHVQAVQDAKKALSKFVNDLVTMLKTDAPQLANRLGDATKGLNIDVRTQTFIRLYGTDLPRLMADPDFAANLALINAQANFVKKPMWQAIAITLVAAFIFLAAAGVWLAQQAKFISDDSKVPGQAFKAANDMMGEYWNTDYYRQMQQDSAISGFLGIAKQLTDLAAKAA